MQHARREHGLAGAPGSQAQPQRCAAQRVNNKEQSGCRACTAQARAGERAGRRRRSQSSARRSVSGSPTSPGSPSGALSSTASAAAGAPALTCSSASASAASSRRPAGAAPSAQSQHRSGRSVSSHGWTGTILHACTCTTYASDTAAGAAYTDMHVRRCQRPLPVPSGWRSRRRGFRSSTVHSE